MTVCVTIAKSSMEAAGVLMKSVMTDRVTGAEYGFLTAVSLQTGSW